MSSFTVTFTGKSSLLRSDFFPEITLDPLSDYCCALLDFSSYNSIANVIEGKNNEFGCKFKIKEKSKQVDKKLTIALPTGTYETEDILRYLKTELSVNKVSLVYEASANASKVNLQFDTAIEWTSGTLLNIIGFQNNNSSRKFESGTKYWSDEIVKITNIDVIRVECDIVSGSYINGKRCHTIHQFSHGKVDPGYKYIEVPRPTVYLPIKDRTIRTIQISIVDQHGQLIDFRGEEITCRLHIKRVNEYGAQ